jgi:hypothetical protein
MASTLDVNDSSRRQPGRKNALRESIDRVKAMRERVTQSFVGADIESYKKRLTKAAGIETVVVEKEYDPQKHFEKL